MTLLHLLGELLLALVAAEIFGWLPAWASALLRVASKFYPENERLPQISEWEQHLKELSGDGRNLWRLGWALAIVVNAVYAGWLRHGQPSLRDCIEIFRTQNALRNARAELQFVEHYRANRKAIPAFLIKRVFKFVAVGVLAVACFFAAAILLGTYPNQPIAITTAYLLILAALVLGQIIFFIQFTRVLDAGIILVFVSFYKWYRPRADRRLIRLETILERLHNRNK